MPEESLIRYYREMEIPQKPLVIDDWIKMSYKTSRIVYLFIPAARMYLVPSSTQLTQILEGQLAHNGVIQSGTTFLSLLRENEERRQNHAAL